MNVVFKFDPNVDMNELGTISVRVMKKNGRIVPQVSILEVETGEEERPGKGRNANFRHLIQHPFPDRLLERLHALIDGRVGADVGCVLLRCIQENLLIRNPTKAEFCSEFQLSGSWQSIHKYMDENNLNALSKANRVMIFPSV